MNTQSLTLGALKTGASSLAIMTALLSASAASAQSGPSAAQLDEVVVTGTSIRGVAPVGSNLISVDREEIAKQSAPNVTQVLTTIPALSNMGVAGRGGNGNGGNGAAVYIHQIGASAQNSTLVLVDGHRAPPSGTVNSVVDPNNIPGIMLERVEVLAEGASATYGSDAVAGVVNFITRRRFDGIEVRGQATHIDKTKLGWQGSIIGGKDWDSGNFVAAYSYSYEDEVENVDRPRTDPLGQTARALSAGLTGTGTTNFGNFNCDPATVQPNATGPIFLSPTSATSVANAAANSTCTNWEYGSLLPTEKRHNAMVRVQQQLGENLSWDADLIYSHRTSRSRVSRGTLTSNAFGPGTPIAGQANPFYINPPGVTATRQQIRFSFDEMYGPGAYSEGGDETIFGSSTLNYKLGGDWEVSLLGSAGRASSYSGENTGVVNTPFANLALNGTAQTSGSTTATSLPGGGNTITLNLPLTTANALDVWNPAATNRTSAAVREAILNSRNVNRQTNALQQVRMTVGGSVFDLPGGAVRVAGGLEYLRTTIDQYITRPLPIAGSTNASSFGRYEFSRHVESGFLEALIPLVGEEMNVPLVRAFDVNLAVRHDRYSDVGGTTNPKASFNWEIIEGLSFRGNVSRSFVAPPLNLVAPPFGNANFASSNGTTANVSVPLANYPILAQMGIPGCTAQSTSCNISSLQGVSGNVGNPENREQKGKGWSLGVDFQPTFLPGFRASATLWDVTFLGGITNPAFNITVNTGTIANRITFYPSCATQAQVQAAVGTQPQASLFPACVQFINIGDNGNYLNFFTRGLDLSASYTWGTDYGRFVVGGDMMKLLEFNQGFAARGELPPPESRFSVKNTVGLNTTFPNVGTQLRGHVGWSGDSAYVDLYANHTASYTNASGTAVNPIQLKPTGVYSGEGGDKVKASTTFDLTVGYRLRSRFGLEETEFAVRIRNLLDDYPPYFNSAAGYDPFVNNILGRTIAVSVRARM
jgi:iron complex outermembrane receptor protein